MNIILLVILLISYVTCYDDPEEERLTLLNQLLRTQTFVQEGYELVGRQSGIRLRQFENYLSVNMMYYDVPYDTTKAMFSFIAEEIHHNFIGSCQPQHIYAEIKQGSYPAVNPDGYSFPKHFVDPSDRSPIYTINFWSDGVNKSLLLDTPSMGDWYIIAYLEWEDPKIQQVAQQGLVPKCETILYSDLQVMKSERYQIVDCYSKGIISDYNSLPKIFKCISEDTNGMIPLRISLTNTTKDNRVEVNIRANGIPRRHKALLSCAYDPSLVDTQIIFFRPYLNEWHYIDILPLLNNSENISDCNLYVKSGEEEFRNTTTTRLMKEQKGRAFTFDFGLPTEDIKDTTSVINITSYDTTHLKFNMDKFVDAGGTLTIEVGVIMNFKYYMGYTSNVTRAFTEEEPFFKVVICMSKGIGTTPTENDTCKYNNKVIPAIFVLNSTDGDSIFNTLSIPYPESGVWFVSMKMFTDSLLCPCRTSHNGTRYYVATEEQLPSENIEELGALKSGHSEGNTTVVLSVRSKPCVEGKCSDHGTCMLNSFNGLMLSYCQCWTGYGGWDCSDDSRMDSRTYMLTSVLLLSLSNLFFSFSIYTAVIRKYYNVAVIYALPLVISTFYHACDAPPQVAYCILQRNILQFGDFYAGLMAFWFTLNAISVLSKTATMTLQMHGAIVIAFLTYWDMRSITAFTVPVVVGVVTVLVSWLWSYKKTGKMLYQKVYYYVYLPIGLTLVAIGLLCFAFLQTENNYRFVHSFWHVMIALSIVFLLPDYKRGPGVNPFLPDSNIIKNYRLFFNLMRNRNIVR